MANTRSAQETGTEDVYSVSEINASAAHLLESSFASAAVEGEISELVKHRSGHWYFTLKDENSMLRVAMFRGQNQRVRFSPEDGNKVIVKGRLTIYGARGSYQLVASTIALAGEGDLLKRFVQLKSDLAALGWFDASRKKPIPSHPRQIAIVTSGQSAALRDMQTTLARRNPGIELIVVSVSVQGPSASSEIANAVSRLNKLSKMPEASISPEAIIVGRGGGSLEDLWAFNERNLAQAIFSSEIPVISAVGHETDFTIADMVADVRAPTPTAAAEMLSRDRGEIIAAVDALSRRMHRAAVEQYARASAALKSLNQRLRSPSHKLQEQAQNLDYTEARLLGAIHQVHRDRDNRASQLTTKLRGNTPESLLQNRNHRLESLVLSLRNNATARLSNLHGDLQELAGKLHAISPLATLGRGYTLTTDEDGKVLTSSEEIVAGQVIQSRFFDGQVRSKVIDRKD